MGQKEQKQKRDINQLPPKGKVILPQKLKLVFPSKNKPVLKFPKDVVPA